MAVGSPRARAPRRFRLIPTIPNPDDQPAGRRQGPRSLWRHADFLRLWAAQSVSQLGDEVTRLALPFVAIVTLGAGPLEMGLLGTFQFLPFLLLTLPAGVWVDRLRRRPILIGADLGRAALLASIPIAFALGGLSIPQLFVVGFLIGCLEVFFDLAHDAYMPTVVERDQIADGNAKFEISGSAASIAGPGLAGVLVGWFTAPLAILFDIASYLGSAILIWRVRRPERTDRLDDGAPEMRSLRREVHEGLVFVLGHRYLRPIVAATTIHNFFGNLAFAVMLLYWVQAFGLSPTTIGLVFAIGNAGVLLGAVTCGPLARRFGIGPTIVAAELIGAPAVLLIAIAPVDAPLPFLIASGIISGWSEVVYNVSQRSFRQAITPDRMRGRMTASIRFVIWGTIPIGTLAGGFLGEIVGLSQAIWIGAIGILFSFVPIVGSPVRTLMTIPEDPASA